MINMHVFINEERGIKAIATAQFRIIIFLCGLWIIKSKTSSAAVNFYTMYIRAVILLLFSVAMLVRSDRLVRT